MTSAARRFHVASALTGEVILADVAARAPELRALRDILAKRAGVSSLAVRLLDGTVELEGDYADAEQTQEVTRLSFVVCTTPPSGLTSFLDAARRGDRAELRALEGAHCLARRDWLLEALKLRGAVLRHASEELRDDGEIVLAAARTDRAALRFASPALLCDRNFGRAAVLLRGSLLEFLPLHLRSDWDVALAAVGRDQWAVKYVAPCLLADEGFVLAAAAAAPLALMFAAPELRNRREFVMAAVHANGAALEHVSDELRGDVGVVLAAVRRRGMALRWASADLRSNRGVVLAAVRREGLALEYASSELRADRVVVRTAASGRPQAMAFAMGDLVDDVAFWLEVFEEPSRTSKPVLPLGAPW